MNTYGFSGRRFYPYTDYYGITTGTIQADSKEEALNHLKMNFHVIEFYLIKKGIKENV